MLGSIRQLFIKEKKDDELHADMPSQVAPGFGPRGPTPGTSSTSGSSARQLAPPTSSISGSSTRPIADRGYVPGRAVARGSGLNVAWVSIDPRHGEVSLYPPAVVARLEEVVAAGAGAGKVVPLGGLGLSSALEGASIDIGELVQRSATGGKRDVRRVDLQAGQREIVFHVVRERGWRFADFSAPGVTEERRVPLAARVPAPAPSGSAASFAVPRHRCGSVDRYSSDQSPEARAASLAKSDAAGHVGLWEWCLLASVDDPRTIDDSMWGVYEEAIDVRIEEAYRKMEAGLVVVVGIRNYEVVFEGPDFGRQVDHSMRKRRFVRRRAVAPEQRIAALRRQATSSVELDGECVICVLEFKDTPTIPVVKLPCGHFFHGACVQHIADKRGCCPCCRGVVDWEAAMSMK